MKSCRAVLYALNYKMNMESLPSVSDAIILNHVDNNLGDVVWSSAGMYRGQIVITVKEKQRETS